MKSWRDRLLVPDVNVLVRAASARAERHEDAIAWLESAKPGPELVGIPRMVLLGVVRILSNKRAFPEGPTAIEALRFCREITGMASFRELNADVEHWDVFERLLIQTGVSGSDVSDVYLAAFAVQNDATFVTFDRGFARFPGLRWMEPGSNDGSGTP